MKTEDLEEIADELAEIRGRFIDSNVELYLRAEDQAQFIGLLTAAKAILSTDYRFGSFVNQLIFSANSGAGGLMGGPSYSGIRESEAIIRQAIRHAARVESKSESRTSQTALKPPFVDGIRIAGLEQLSAAKDRKWDYSKLARLCRELNVAHENDCFYSVAMLCRAIADHVPPVFGAKDFAEASAQSSKSLKKSMAHLQNGLRNMADGVLHVQIRVSESTPTGTQVDYRPQIDELLGELIRLAKHP